jgi:hypothetical protein
MDEPTTVEEALMKQELALRRVCEKLDKDYKLKVKDVIYR